MNDSWKDIAATYAMALGELCGFECVVEPFNAADSFNQGVVRARFRKDRLNGVIIVFEEESEIGSLGDERDKHALQKLMVSGGSRLRGESFAEFSLEEMRRRLMPGR